MIYKCCNFLFLLIFSPCATNLHFHRVRYSDFYRLDNDKHICTNETWIKRTDRTGTTQISLDGENTTFVDWWTTKERTEQRIVVKVAAVFQVTRSRAFISWSIFSGKRSTGLISCLGIGSCRSPKPEWKDCVQMDSRMNWPIHCWKRRSMKTNACCSSSDCACWWSRT